MKKIKIGLDFHGVLNYNPLYFASLAQNIINKGWELHIITGGPKKMIEAFLGEYQIHYTSLYTILEEAEDLGIVTYLDNDSFYVPEEFWNRAKGEYCRKNCIDIHIDDSVVYSKYFVTPYCLYNKDEQKGKIINTMYEIIFGDDIASTIKQIEQYICNK